MKNVVNELYDKYSVKVTDEIEQDEFYQYFYNLLETGTTMCQFYNRKLIKDVDEEWVEQIEKAIPHIVTVVDNPRKFIEEERQIVNVALARKFTPESVKHLSQHSYMVNKVNDDGTVEPNKILNVTKEESMNTYENRFIYTLLMELKNFVVKRYEGIFEGVKDEDGVKLNLESLIDNYTEVVSYKMEVRIREKQAEAANDGNNVNIFTRIAKIHKMVLELCSSGFMIEMKKFSMVKHPIVKTNAIAKNPAYKACYNLWNYMHAYERIGYKVSIIEQDPSVSRSFETDLYNAILTNYVVVRKHMQNMDLLNIDREKRTKEIGLKDIRQFIKEVVNEYDMPPKELKKLIANELDVAIKNKQYLEEKRKVVKDHVKGQKGLIHDEAGDWQAYKSGAANLAPGQSGGQVGAAASAQTQQSATGQGTVQADEQEEKETAAFNNSLFSMNPEDINRELIAGGALGEEILLDARFCRLARKIEKSRKKKQLRDGNINKRYQELAKDDVGKAQRILDKAEDDEQRRIRKNERARRREVEKAKRDEERIRQKEISNKLKSASRVERKAAKAEKEEQMIQLKKQHRLELEHRKELRQIEKEIEQQARDERKAIERNNKIEEKKKSAIEKEKLKVSKTEYKQNKKLEKEQLNATLKKERKDNAILRKEERAQRLAESSRRKAQLKNDSKMLRIKEKERKESLRLQRSAERKQEREERIKDMITRFEKRKEEREIRRIELKKLRQEQRVARVTQREEQRERRRQYKKQEREKRRQRKQKK